MKAQPKPRIAIFGASFDPPHFAHAAMVIAALISGHCDQVWICPSLPRWDKTQATPINIRVKWAHALTTHLQNLGFAAFLCLDELNFSSFFGTFYFLEYLQEHYQNYNFCLLVGQDSWNTIPYWKNASKNEINGDKLLQKYKVLVVPRINNPSSAEVTAPHVLLASLSAACSDFDKLFNCDGISDLSSTAIRKKLNEKQATNQFIFPELQREIEAYYKTI